MLLEVNKMRQKFTLRRFFLVGLLISGLIGLMVIYFSVVSSLPSQIYSAAQYEFLSRNYVKSVYQMAPVLNEISADGIIEAIILPWRRSHVRAYLKAQQEEFESVSATIYDLEFYGEYTLGTPGNSVTEVELFFPFPSNLETLHEVNFLVDGEEPPGVQYSTQGIRWQTQLFPEEEHNVKVSYFADGANTFTYALPHEQRSDVDIAIAVSGLTGSTVPKTSLPATDIDVKEEGETLTWNYTNLIADRDIQITLPTELSFAQRVAQLQDDFRSIASMAPFFVGLSLLSLAGVFHLSGLRLRIESYLLIGCGLALFYPMLTFLSGLLEVTLAAALSLLFIITLLLTFIRMTTGQKNMIWRASLIFIVFLGFFSLGMLTSWRGILLTSGALILLGTFMILYARRPMEPEPALVTPSEELAQETEMIPPSQELPTSPESTPKPILEPLEHTAFHCPYCGRELEMDFSFCPDCGRDASQVQQCKNCGHKQFLPSDQEKIYCLNCGEPLM
jgi:hypothetical protein